MSFHDPFFNAPIPNLLVASGIIFLLIAILGEVSGKFETDRKGRIAGGIIGSIFIITGLLLSPAVFGLPAGSRSSDSAPTDAPASTLTSASATSISTSTPMDTPTPTASPVPDAPTPTATPSPTPTPVDPGKTEFLKTVVTGETGQEIEIPISLGRFDELYLVVGDESVNFIVEAWISDGSRDHNITVILDTGAANTDRPILKPKNPDDTVDIEREDYPSSLRNLEPGDYELTLYINAFKDSSRDVATLFIEEAG